jgi:glycosyltransferase involved in cell wall biosynthesis
MVLPVQQRIAILTPANPLSETKGGGPARYLWRMTEALCERGHEVEHFAPHECSTVEYADGVRVNLVGCVGAAHVASQGRRRRLIYRCLRKLGLSVLSDVASQLSAARALACVVEARHAERPFDIIQSNSYRLVGAAIKRRPDRVHVIRCSSSRHLYNRVDGTSGSFKGWFSEACENWTFRRVDGVYAPSRLVAQVVAERTGVPAAVVRPPLAASDLALAKGGKHGERYLLHYGQIGRRKGSDCLMEALPLAWRQCPDLQMLWAGPCFSAVQRYESFVQASKGRVRWLGHLPASELFPLIANAESTVLPSRVDNLPNSVIENRASTGSSSITRTSTGSRRRWSMCGIAASPGPAAGFDVPRCSIR